VEFGEGGSQPVGREPLDRASRWPSFVKLSLTVKNPTIMTSTGQNSSPAAHTTAPPTKSSKAGRPALAKVMWAKCKKRETPHASKKCGTCCSNDPKYKRRKVVHRNKQQRARQQLQASSRQAVQESATVTATARPLLNLSTMAATSTVSSQPSRTRSQKKGGPQ